MLEFYAEYALTADVEVIPIQKINEAYERMLRSDVKYRFSIDMRSLNRRRDNQDADRGSPVLKPHCV